MVTLATMLSSLELHSIHGQEDWISGYMFQTVKSSKNQATQSFIDDNMYTINIKWKVFLFFFFTWNPEGKKMLNFKCLWIGQSFNS